MGPGGPAPVSHLYDPYKRRREAGPNERLNVVQGCRYRCPERLANLVERGGEMATRLETATPEVADRSELQQMAIRHLWMHFTRMGSYADHEVPIIVRGEGCYVWDEHGKRYLDG